MTSPVETWSFPPDKDLPIPLGCWGTVAKAEGSADAWTCVDVDASLLELLTESGREEPQTGFSDSDFLLGGFVGVSTRSPLALASLMRLRVSVFDRLRVLLRMDSL
jgi:hypothetical protein